MKFEVVLNQLGLVFGMLVYWCSAVPMDASDAALVMAQVGGAVLDMAQEVNPQMDFNTKIVAGPFQAERSALFKAKNERVADDEDRKRRKRSVHADDEMLALPEEHRSKRSPCSGRRRRQSTTDATPTTDDGSGTSDDLPRRRKRSPENSNEIDENVDMIPFHRTIGEGWQDVTRKLEHFFKNFADAVTGMVQRLKQNVTAAEQYDPKYVSDI